ncbi:MAG: AAA family ATPase [Streptosporangiaceae bacterium]
MRGGQAGAVAAFDEYRDRLAAETGLQPTPQACQIRQRIMAGQPADGQPGPRPAARPRPQGSPPGRRDPFLGREEECAVIAGAAAGRGPRVVLVTGPSGIGKSALLAEAARQADALVLAAQAFAPDQDALVADTLSQHAAIGRLGQICDRWIYSVCLCFGLDLAEQARSGFGYSYSIYQAEYSRNLLFACGGQMEDLFDRICDRTRSRLDIPALRTLFGLKNRPHHNQAARPPAQEIVIENSQYGLTWFRIRFGLLQLKAYTKGEHVLRLEATVHNTKELRCRRSLDNFPEIITRLAGMAGRFATTLDCADISFLPDGTLDDLPLPSRISATRTGGIDLNKPRIRAALAAALALAAAPHGFTVAEFTARVSAMSGQASYTIRQGSYDLRKLRGKGLAVKPARTRRYHIPPDAARTIAALLALRDHVIAPIIAGIRSPRRGRKPATWTRIDRDYEALRIGMQGLFNDLGIATPATAAA